MVRMEEDEGLLKNFVEEKQFFDVLQHFLDQINDRPNSVEFLEPLPEVFANNLYGYLTVILDRYQEQPYLLDPHLERMVKPITLSLRKWLVYLQNHTYQSDNPSADLVHKLDAESLSQKMLSISRLLYFIIKVRGYKTIVRFFPHSVHDLSLVVSSFALILPKSDTQFSQINETFSQEDQWPLRFILLLWLSLICTLPFDLSRFDQLKTLQAQNIPAREYIERVGWSYLRFPGKEREASALVLAKLLSREDVFHAHLPPFTEKCLEQLGTAAEHDVFLVTGILQVLCLLVKLARPAQLLSVLPSINQAILATSSLPYISSSINLRKLRTKLFGRVALIIPLNSVDSSARGDVQVPESIETAVSELLGCLQDKDTVVRWSGAKYLAKIGRRLRQTYSVQICDAILELFSLQTGEAKEGKIDLLSANDHTWQGACLACAEFLRRKCFPPSRLEALIEWVVRALHFEQRKGVQSIGSGVRDSAAYVLWSFGRAFSPTDMKPFAHELAVQLVLQSLFDREVHIRRAGSAAFQENVGRLGVFPHGIEVLQRADFFTVGLRRSAFLKAAPEVARFEEYRQPILDHLMRICIGHWDHVIRELASQSVCQIMTNDFGKIPSTLLCQLESNLQSKDVNLIHGSLLILGELAKLVQDHQSLQDDITVRDKIFQVVSSVLDSNFTNRQLAFLSVAICQALTPTLPTSAERCEKFLESPAWKQLVDIGLKRPDDGLHLAVQNLFHEISLRGVGGGQVKIFSRTLHRGSPVARQASARYLGGFVFSIEALSKYFKPTFEILATHAASLPPSPSVPIEVTRNSLESLISIVVNLEGRLGDICTQEQFSNLLTKIFEGLNNYTNDYRGDVGSWVRISSLRSVEKVLSVYVKSLQPTSSTPTGDNHSQIQILNPNCPHLDLDRQYLINFVFSRILRQTLESIDSVREIAWGTMSRVLVLLSGSTTIGIDSTISDVVKSTFDSKSSESWRDLECTFPKSLDLLLKLVNFNLTLAKTGDQKHENPILSSSSLTELTQNSLSLSDSLLEGIILLIGGKGNSNSKKAALTFANYLRSIGNSNKSTLEEILKMLLRMTRARPIGSKNFGLSCWNTIFLLLQSSALEPLESYQNGHKLLNRILTLATHGVNQPAVSLDRVLVGSKIAVKLTAFKTVRIQAADHLKSYLCYDSPRVRVVTAEAWYEELQLQNDQVPEAERLLSETKWSECDIDQTAHIAQQIMTSMHDAWKLSDG